MKKLIGTLLLMMVTRFASHNASDQGRSVLELGKLKMNLLYLRGIKTSRYMFMSLLGLAVCRGLFLFGFVLLHAALFIYSPWSQQTKMNLALGFGALYLIIGGVVCSMVFTERRWIHMFHAEKIIDQLKARQAHQQPAAAEV